jgi:hypothetical protein
LWLHCATQPTKPQVKHTIQAVCIEVNRPISQQHREN